MMIRIVAGLVAALAASSFAQAAEMHPMQATSISLGQVTGIAYYQVVGDDFQVVATLAAGEEGTPMRFVTTLVDGQKMLLSVPQAADQAPIELEFARLGDSLSVSEASTIFAMTN
jgi:hypothetical protein